MNTPGRSYFSKAGKLLVVAMLVVGALALAGCGANQLLGEGGPEPAAELPGTWIPSSGDELVFNRGGDAYFGKAGAKFTWRVEAEQTDPTQLVFVHPDGTEEIRAFELVDEETLKLYDGDSAGGKSVEYHLLVLEGEGGGH